MRDAGRTPNWPVAGALAALAAIAGFGAARWLAPSPQSTPEAERPAPSAAAAEDLLITSERVRAAGIAVEPVVSGGAGAGVVASATVTAGPGGEATVVARASGTVTLIRRRLGDPVRAGEVLATVESRDAAAMSAERSVASARAELARKTYAREAALFRQGVTPRQDVEAAQSALAVAEAEARRAAAVARAAGVGGNGGSVVVVSPIAGRITAAAGMLGAYVEPAVEMFRVARTDAVQIEAAVTAADARRIRPGDEATLVPASGIAVRARVRSVTPTLGGASRSATAVLTPLAGAETLAIGEGLQVRIETDGDGPANLSVPEDAVQNLAGRDVLFVRTARGFRARPVLVGTRSGGMARIVSGVVAGERVATRNAFLLKAEMAQDAGEEE